MIISLKRGREALPPKPELRLPSKSTGLGEWMSGVVGHGALGHAVAGVSATAIGHPGCSEGNPKYTPSKEILLS